ncbi:MAG: hypothetical protein B7X06_03530 [Verrucomicrobia bacterium 21-51-4]|nr:MAG: hypothetical protein B7X06_03530 [Verrucomicrobia bacterium 21-51-4]
MDYSMAAGGKRLRPLLVLASHALFPSATDPLPAAVAVECMHTATLIHDDLPILDNSDLRRGIPTCHKHFDAPTALLAGDALMIYPFSLLSKAYIEDTALALDLVSILSEASGSTELIGGQMEDIQAESEAFVPNNPDNAARIEYIHLHKTASLMAACIEMGLRLSTAPKELYPVGQTLGLELGLMFQIVDDILDTASDTETLGKPAGLDEKNGKLTYPRLFGIEASKQKATEHLHKALKALEALQCQDPSFLKALMEQMLARSY